MNIICAGRSLLFRAPNDLKPHLWLILTDSAGDPGRVVAVMLRSAKPYTDPTFILEPSDHPFIKHSSSVHFSSARFFNVGAINRALSVGSCHLLQDMSRSLLSRVREGLLELPYTVNAIKDYCREHF